MLTESGLSRQQQKRSISTVCSRHFWGQFSGLNRITTLVFNLAEGIPNVRKGWLQEILPDVVGQRNRDNGDHTQQFVEHAATAAAPHHDARLFSRLALVSLGRSSKTQKRQKRAELCDVEKVMRQLISALQSCSAAVSVRGWCAAQRALRVVR